MSDTKPGKIHVLLIDDKPNGLPQDIRWPERGGGPPQMDADYHEWFDFRWLATPKEACEYRDLSWLVAHHDPGLLGTKGWVPELLIIDYALTTDDETVADRVRQYPQWHEIVSPLPALRQCAAGLPDGNSNNDEPLPKSPPVGHEYWGCYIGGLLMNTFGEHPCAPLTCTRYSETEIKTNAPDVAFFEWLMHVQSNGLLRARNLGSSPSWREILLPAAKNLRHRLLALAKAKIVQVSLEDLTSLAENSSYPELTVSSRYGRRRYPVKGLFVDIINNESWDTTIKTFAKDLLNCVVEYSALKQAQQLANDLWAVYDPEPESEWEKLRIKRHRLSDLTTSDKTSADLEVPRNALDVKGDNCMRYVDLRKGPNNTIRRWAAVLIAYKLALRMARLRKKIDDCGWSSLGDPKIIENDLWCALFPLPRNPIELPVIEGDGTYHHNNWEKVMSRAGLSITDVVSGRPWVEGEGKPKGLKRAERYLLQCMALGEEELLDGRSPERSVLWRCLPSRLIIWGDETED